MATTTEGFAMSYWASIIIKPHASSLYCTHWSGEDSIANTQLQNLRLRETQGKSLTHYPAKVLMCGC